MGKLAESQREEAIEAYKHGTLASEISLKYGVSKAAFLKLLERRGVEKHSLEYVHSSSREIKLDKFSFDLEVQNDCYWMGFLSADAGATREPYIVLNLGAKDLDHLLKFRTYLGSTHKVITRETGVMGLSIGSRRLFSSLKHYGLTGYKEDRRPIEALHKDPNFLRGLIDADGCIRNVSESLINLEIGSSLWVANLFLDLAGNLGKSKANIRRHKGAFNIRFGDKTTRNILDYCRPVFGYEKLDRKWSQGEEGFECKDS